MQKFKFEIHHKDPKSKARTGVIKTLRGEINTPCFMPVGTCATVKALTSEELLEIGAEIILANTYHLHLRPGSELIKNQGRLHKWMNWQKPILTDSGGFQVFSLGLGGKNSTALAKIHEDGVEFRSFIDGSKHFFSPEKVMEIQEEIGADIVMSFDECAPANAEKYYLRDAMNRTHRWLERCRIHHEKLDFAKQFQTLVPIIQGGVFDELRAESAHFINSFEWSAYAIGGLSVGESKEDMMRTLEVTIPILPEEKPKYLMGVGTPEDLLEAVSRGVDMFDCVLATRLARHGTFWAHDENGKFQKFHIKNEKFKFDPNPLDGDFTFSKLKNFSKSYIRHLIMCNEILGLRILSIHNLFVLLDLMKKTRQAIEEDTFHELCERYL